MRINTNLTAMNTYSQYTKNNNKIASSVEKLSSGYAINSAADNATGLAISEKMRAQIRGLEKASTNSQDAISLIQTAEGSLSESTEILQRMRELSVQSSSDTNQDEIDRTALQDEFSQLQSELDDIASNTTFNKKTLLDGSLSASTKKLTSTSIENSGMTIELGNAATGSYNFSVTTKLESAAVAGKAPTSANMELVMGDADSYFSAGTVTAGTNINSSDLLNGNYSLSAEYGDDGCITVTATGDNDQTLSATIKAADLEALSGSTSLSMTFNPEAEDAFSIALTLGSTISSSENNFDTLSENISNLSVSVSGGVTAKEAQYGVYANLTGAKSVKLESGMDSVSFSNGVKVNFDTLSASSVDTTNDAAVTNAKVLNAPSAAATDAAFGAATFGSAAATVSAASWTAFGGNNVIADGAFSITSDSSGVLTLSDADGATYTAAAVNTAGGAAAQTANYTFTNTDDSSKTFNATLSVTLSADPVTAVPLAFAGTMRGTNGVALTGEAAGTGPASLSNFTFTDDSTVANGALAFTSAVDGSNTVFTATDTAGNAYTATVATASMLSGNAYGTTSNALTFTGAGADVGFTATLDTINGDNVNGTTPTTFTPGAQLTATVANAGHNYAKTFSASTSDLSASTASSFSVEETSGKGLTFQVGANEGDNMTIYIDKMDSNYLGVASASVATQSSASSAIGAVDDAINQVSSQRAYLGAIQNRLDHKIANLDTSAENLTAAESQIRDVDMAKEMTKFTNANILQQAATAMLAQANSLPQNVLSLIG